MGDKSKQTPAVKDTFTVLNDRGLHTRPSTEIVKCLARFKCDISLTYKKTTVNARSLLGILMLAAERGSKIGIIARGSDAKEAVSALMALANDSFHMTY